jgi:hypothetical protein
MNVKTDEEAIRFITENTFVNGVSISEAIP